MVIVLLMTFGDFWVYVAHYFAQFDGVVVARSNLR